MLQNSKTMKTAAEAPAPGVASKQCKRCGKEFSGFSENGRKRIGPAKYCAPCSTIVRAEQNRERQRRYKEAHRAQ